MSEIKHTTIFNVVSFVEVESWYANLVRQINDDVPDSIELNFLKVREVEVLGAAILLRRFKELIKKTDSKISILLPANTSRAAFFFYDTRFAPIADELGVEIIRSTVAPLVQGNFVAFEAFNSRMEAESYLNTKHVDFLTESFSRAALPNVIEAHDFSVVLLKELVLNSFTHGTGSFAFFCAGETPSNSSIYGTLGTPLDTQMVYEITVSDFNTKSLPGTLGAVFKKEVGWKSSLFDFVPERAPVEVLRVLYALEYGTTSQPDRRAKEIMAACVGVSEKIDPASIATGLYHVATVAKLYQGQIVVRTGPFIVVCDFRGRGSVSFSRSIAVKSSKQRLSLLAEKGTVLSIRIPMRVGRNISPPAVAQTLGTKPSLKWSDSVFISLHDQLKSVGGSENWLVFLERKLRETLSQGSVSHAIISINSNTLSTKEVAVLASLMESWWWCKIPHVAILSHSSAIPDVWGNRNSFLAKKDAMPVDVRLLGPSEHLDFFGEAAESFFSNILKPIVESPPVYRCLPDELYLIEGHYYTNKFYSIHNALEHPDFLMFFELYIQQKIRRFQPAVIAYNLAAFKPLIEKAVSSVFSDTPSARPEVLFIYKREASEVAFEIGGNTERVFFVIDVLCTGSSLDQLLKILPSRSMEKELLAVVDARDSTSKEYIVDIQYDRFKIPLSSVKKDRIVAIPNPGIQERKGKRILRAKPETKELLSLGVHDHSVADVRELISDGVRQNFLSVGHHKKHNKHYLFYFDVERLGREKQRELVRWLTSEARTALIEPTQVKNRQIWVDQEFPILTSLVDLAVGALERQVADDEIKVPSPVKPPSSQKISDGPSPNNDCLWIVLPGLSGGSTLQDALAAASKRGFRKVHVSVILSRANASTTNFFSSIKEMHSNRKLGGGKAEGRGESLGSMAVEFAPYTILSQRGYTPGNCPLCSLINTLEHHAATCSVEHPNLEKIVRQVAADVGAESYNKQRFPDIASLTELAMMRNALEGAFDYHDSPQMLRDSVEAPIDVIYLAIAIGMTLDEPYIDNMVARVLGALELTDDAIAYFCARIEDLLPFVFPFLIGMEKLDPEATERHFVSLYNAVSEHKRALEDFLCACVFIPDLAIHKLSNLNGQAESSLMKEWKRYIIYRKYRTTSVGQLHFLNRFLDHKGEHSWQGTFFALQSNKATADVEVKLDKFLETLKNTLRDLKVIEPMWFPSDDLDFAEPNLRRAGHQLISELETLKLNLGRTAIHEEVSKRANASVTKMRDEIEKIAKTPERLIHEYTARTQTSLVRNVHVEDNAQVAVSAKDFERVLINLDHNNTRHAGGCGYDISLRLATSNNESFILMEVRQDHVWKEPESDLGHLKTLIQIAKKHGGYCEINPPDCDSVLIIAFPIWPLNSDNL